MLLGSGTHVGSKSDGRPGASWVGVPSTPAGCRGVADVGGEIDTFVVTGSDLAVWAWTPASVGWSRTATIVVPVPYGSSS